MYGFARNNVHKYVQISYMQVSKMLVEDGDQLNSINLTP